ncbi:FAD:protein FMN transferase, partial [Ruminococcaceae bacterium OttesenSCG-928-O06]|nr:FAD:protein FMN transferase [Ruminococcaceae bacterium OttesenSCG-928-O06]
YARGTKPDGTPWRVGFANPGQDGPAYIASFQLRDAVIAVSGAYQRYTEIDGARYGHIFDPRTGYPAESDIVSVGVIHADGATADFYSTTLYVQGLDAALTYIKEGGAALVLDEGNTLYVAESLREGFLMNEEAQGYQVEFVAQTAA